MYKFIVNSVVVVGLKSTSDKLRLPLNWSKDSACRMVQMDQLDILAQTVRGLIWKHHHDITKEVHPICIIHKYDMMA